MVAQIVGFSLSVSPGEAAYIPLRHSYAGAPDQLPVEMVLARLKPWLENADAPKLGQNIKYDSHVLANAGITVRGYVHDTLLESYVLEAHKPHSLESLAQRHLGRSGLSYEDVCGKGAHQIPFAQVDIEKASQYSVRRQRDDAAGAPDAVAAGRGRQGPALRLREDRDAGGGHPAAHRAQWRADRPGPAGAAKPAARRTHAGAGARGARARRPALQHGHHRSRSARSCSPSWACR